MRSILPLFIACILTMLPYAAAFAGESATLVREEQKIIIDGVEERWRLVWESKPEPVCAANEADWMTCPCSGFAYGESGKLTLVRKRAGQKEERLSLDQFFSYGETPGSSNQQHSILRRWDVQEQDNELIDSPELAERVKTRKITRIMNFGDYDHDGRASEFILQIGNLPCGKQTSVVVGISKSNPHLHVFSSIKTPSQPLILLYQHWQLLEKAKGTVKGINWQCGDHGSETKEEVVLKARNGKISATLKTYSCDEKGRGKLIKSIEF